jgi:hypothetical protein
LKPAYNFGSKEEKGKGRNTRDIFAEGETLKYRPPGRIFELKKRTEAWSQPAVK